MMNERTRALGLEDTRFRNPTGLDARGQHSTARDLAAIARAGFQYPLFRKAVDKPYATVSTEYRTVEFVTTNELLASYPAATGVKTGFTLGAGPCLVASAAKGDEAYVSVVLGDEERFEDSRRLLEHGFAAYDRAVLVEKGKRYAWAKVPYRREERVGLTAARDVEALIREGSEVEREVEVMGEPPDSADPGAELGEVVVRIDGASVGDSTLLTREGYDEASSWDRVWYAVEGFWRGI
jgi:D-alanyl-D-alanine carboxypeptidase (penicillin-binding protein 5/6)